MFVRLAVAFALLVMLAVCAIVAAARIPVFTVTGDLDGSLQPGAEIPLNLVISNHHSYPVLVRSLLVTISAVDNGSTDPSRKCAITNFSVTQGVGLAPMTVKPHSRVSLTDLGITQANWPHIRMRQISKSAQANCKNARLTLHYSAPGWFWT
jgi:hypothetical protein